MGARCDNCGSENLIKDMSTSETVCAKCNTVFSGPVIDRSAEWRAYGPENSNKIRGGPAFNPLRHDGGMGIEIGKGSGELFKVHPRKRAQFHRMRMIQKRQGSSRDRNLRMAMSEINRCGGYLSLSKSIQEKIAMLYRRAMDEGIVRGRSTESVIAALVYISCREEGAPRTMEEVAKALYVDKKEVGKTYRFVSRKLGVRIVPAKAQEYVPRFGGALGVAEKTQLKAVEIIEDAASSDSVSGKGPIGVAAAALYLATCLTGERKTQKEVADRLGVTEVTVRNRCKEMVAALNIEEGLDAC